MIEQENFDRNDTADVAAGSTSDKVEKASRFGLYTKSSEPRTQGAWRKWLGLTNMVEGDLSRKARLMLELQRGVDYVETEAARQGIVYKRPAIGVFPSERNDPSYPERIGEFFGTHIFIATWYLEEASRYSQEEPISFFGSDETLVYAGATVPEYFFLFGVEEAHHALFDQREGIKELSRLHPKATPLALYDAQDHEYEALQWQIEAARALGFPEETVETLQHCLQAATTVREEQELTNDVPEGTNEDNAVNRNKGQENTGDDPYAAVPADTLEATDTLSGLENERRHPEENGLDTDEQESDRPLQVEEHAPPDNGYAAGNPMHSPKDAARYSSHDLGEPREPTSSSTQDTTRSEQDYDDGR